MTYIEGSIGPVEPPDVGGRLVINGVDLHCPGWAVLDVRELWVQSPNYRGSNVIIPGAAGERAYPRRRDAAVYSLRMVISGVVDDVGNEYSDPWVGLEANLAMLRPAIEPPNPPTKTRAATLTTPGGTVLNADVQPLGIRLGEGPGPVFRALFELGVPAGRFT